MFKGKLSENCLIPLLRGTKKSLIHRAGKCVGRCQGLGVGRGAEGEWGV